MVQNAEVPTQKGSRVTLLYIRNDITGRTFLVVTGALMGVFLPLGLDTHSHSSVTLLEAANVSTTDTYGERLMTLPTNGSKFGSKFMTATTSTFIAT